jgi:ATP-dependent Lon protease
VKEKSLAAQRAGIKRIVLPERNKGDVEEILEHEREGLGFIYVTELGDVLDVALEAGDQ